MVGFSSLRGLWPTQPTPLTPTRPTMVSRLVIWFSVLSRSCFRYRFFLSSSLARLQRGPSSHGHWTSWPSTAQPPQPPPALP